MRYPYDGSSLDYFKHFGGKDQDFPTDIKVYGVNLYIIGYSISATLSTNTYDIIIISCTKSTAAINWIRRLGTSTFPEYSKTIAVYPVDGSLFMTGTINSVDFSYGSDDILLYGLSASGDTLFVENLGNSNADEPDDIVYNSYT